MKKQVIVWVLLMLTSGSFAQTKTEQLDELLSAYVRKNQFNGTALVYEKGVVLLQKGYGLRDADKDLNNNAHTVYQLGSVTKQFTAAVVLKLVEQGKLKLSDPLSRFFPDYPKGDSITIHHLLAHTSGIYNYTDNGDFIQNHVSEAASRETMMGLFKDKALNFSPGGDWAYSNSGSLLLGYIIEKVTQQPYETVVRQLIFKPLGMTHSGFDYAHLAVPNKATGYFSVQENKKGLLVDSTVSHAAGAIFSTTDDLLKWHKALLSNQLLKRSSLEKAFTPYKNQFGYGWVVDSFTGKKGVYHNGSILGFTSNIYRVEADDVCIILLCNIGTPKIGDITEGLLSVLYNKPYTVPKDPKAVLLSAEAERACTGIYEFSPRFKASIRKDGGKMYAQRVGEAQRHLLTPIAANRFFVHDVEQELEFTDMETGIYRKAILHTGEQPMHALRIGDNTPTLSDTIAQLDKAMFEAFNSQDLEKLLSFFSTDLEFFHDLGGLTRYADNKTAFEQNFKSGKNIRRSLVESSLEVYPVPNYGAIQVGEHTFCHPENGEMVCGTFKFVHVWQRVGDVWKISRVVSFGH